MEGINLSVLFSGIIALILSVHTANADIGYGILGCWRDHPSTKATFTSVIATINRYVDGEPKQPGEVLQAVSQSIWPSHDVSAENMYCFDEEIHGQVAPEQRRNFSNILSGFRPAIDIAINMTQFDAQSPQLGKSLHDIHLNVSYFFGTFLQVMDIEKGSLYFREYTLILLGVQAELVNYYRMVGDNREVTKWKNVLARDCYALSKYSYWFIRFMSKKMADNIILDAYKLDNNQLGFSNQVNAKRLNEYDEPLSKCAANDNNNCIDYAFGFLKSARITARHKWQEYWKDVLQDFRKLLFKRYCLLEACQSDRYAEFLVHVGERVGLQFLASNGENAKFCSKDMCSTMWLSTAGNRDFLYYRPCFRNNPLELPSDQCAEDTWKICTRRGGCNPNILLTNNYYPLALRSMHNGLCVDCTETSTWCKQGMCPVYVHNATRPFESSDSCDIAPENCKGPQFQIHNFDRGVNEPLEILDEVHFTYASSKEGNPKFLSGDVYSGAFLRTQYYMRIEERFTVSSKKTGITSGPYYCGIGKPWSMMNVEERAACGQSSYTLFKAITQANVIAVMGDGPIVASSNDDSSRRNERYRARPGGNRVLTGDDAP